MSRPTKWTMQAISSEALPPQGLPATPKGVTKWYFIYDKRAKAKNSVITYVRVPRVQNDQCKQFLARLTPASNPKRVTPYIGNEFNFIYVKRAKAKNIVISYIRVARVRDDQFQQFYAWLYPCQQPQKG